MSKTSTKSQENRSKNGIVSGLVGLVVNIILVIIKVIAGLLANSVSILADAMNSLGDTFGAILTIGGFLIANRPPDREHPYGHQRAEYISGLFTSIIVLVVGFQFLISSIEKILSPTSVNSSQLVLVLLAISIAFKIGLGLYYYNKNKQLKTKSSAITALVKDSISDVLMSLVIIISYIIEVQFDLYIDGYIGTFIALFVIYSGITSIIESANDLLGIRPTPEQVETMQQVLDSYDTLIGYHDLILHQYGPNKIFATVDLEIDSTWDIVEAHDLIDTIEYEFKDTFEIELVSHLDPIEIDNSEQNEIHGIVKKTLKSYSKEFHFHDFRIRKINGQKEIYFEIVVPNMYEESDAVLFNEIENDLSAYEETKNMSLNIHFDHHYILSE